MNRPRLTQGRVPGNSPSLDFIHGLLLVSALPLLVLANLTELLQNLAQHQRIVVHIDLLFPFAIVLPQCHRLDPELTEAALALIGDGICHRSAESRVEGVRAGIVGRPGRRHSPEEVRLRLAAYMSRQASRLSRSAK